MLAFSHSKLAIPELEGRSYSRQIVLDPI